MPSDPRIAVVADYREEGWLSMDHVAEMSHQSLSECGDVRADLLRPVLRRRFRSVNANRFAGRFYDYPGWLRSATGDYDLFHIADHSYAHLALCVPHGRAVVSCHDIDAFRCLLSEGREPRPWWFRAFTRRILKGLRSAVRVVCGAATVQRQLIEAGLLRAEKTVVIHTGIHPTCSALPDSAADRVAEQLLRTAEPVFDLLNVGSTIARKDIDTLLRVFAAAKAENPVLRLVRAGGKLTAAQRRLAEDLKIGDAICELPYLERPVLAAVYRRCGLVLQPSIAEGFGLPVVEAMACGTPVIASDIAVFRETAGEAIHYCSVGAVEQWAATVKQLVSRPPAVAAALARASRYTWHAHAAQLRNLYHEILT